jgi:hypothetical protein
MRMGSSWESSALKHIAWFFNNRDIYFRVIHTGAELVLLVMSKGKRYGFEFTPTRWRRNIILKA